MMSVRLLMPVETGAVSILVLMIDHVVLMQNVLLIIIEQYANAYQDSLGIHSAVAHQVRLYQFQVRKSISIKLFFSQKRRMSDGL